MRYVPMFPSSLILLLLLAACGPDASDTPPADADTTGAATGAEAADLVSAEVVTDSAVRAQVASTARPVAGALMQTLSGRLRTAIDERGAAGALEFCNVEALPLTARVAEEQGMQVKRTSLRLRNPDNAPDPAEAAALAWYRERVEGGGEIPEFLVQTMDDGSHRYYQPLVTQELCVQCHGAPDDLAPGVADAVARLYPEDRAVGYAEGEWRGLLRVSIPAGAGPSGG